MHISDDVLQKASQTLGTNPQELKNAANSGKINNLLKNLNTEQAQQVEKILSDKNAASKLLSTPKAQQLLKKLMGEK